MTSSLRVRVLVKAIRGRLPAVAVAAAVLVAAAPPAAARPEHLEDVEARTKALLGVAALPCPIARACVFCHINGNLDGDDGGMRPQRGGPFYDSLVNEAGWRVTTNQEANRTTLRAALDRLGELRLDSDGDRGPDLAEIAAGHNPVAPLNLDNPETSKLCPAAGPFPSAAMATDGGARGDAARGAGDGRGAGGDDARASEGGEAGVPVADAGAGDGAREGTGSGGAGGAGAGVDAGAGGNGGAGAAPRARESAGGCKCALGVEHARVGGGWLLALVGALVAMRKIARNTAGRAASRASARCN